MKIRRLCAALVLAAVLCAGCGPAPQAESSAPLQNDPLLATWSDEPVMVQLAEDDARRIVDEDETLARSGGLLLEHWGQGVLNVVTSPSAGEVIVPQHRGHRLAAENYHIDAAGTAWVEWPAPPAASDDQWYIYTQPTGGAVTLLDQGTYNYKRDGMEGGALSMAASGGNVLWASQDGVQLYRADSGETTVLDAATAAEVALGDTDAVWLRQDNMLMHADLASGAVSELATLEEGAGTLAICGRKLILHKDASDDLWVYDLAEGDWSLHIESQPGIALTEPTVLDDEHIALIRESATAPYQLMVASLATGEVQPVESAPYTPLYVLPTVAGDDALEDVDYAASRLQPIDPESGTAIALVRQQQNGRVENIIVPMTFIW